MKIPFFSWLYLITICSLLANFGIFVVSGQCLHDQRDLLIELKNSLKFYSTLSTKLVHWNESQNCCLWKGVTCSEEGRVIGLNLFNESISGSLHNSSLFSLQYLENLNLAYNNFSNSRIPAGLGNLMNLSYLNLSNAGFSGQIPIEISNLKRLVTLDLSTSSLLSFSMLKLENPNLAKLVQNFSVLKELYLDGVNISAPGNEWCQALSSSVPNLRVLSMSDCYLSGPFNSSLSKLQSLSIIRLHSNPFNALVPEFFANFTNLTFLLLSSCGLNGRFPEKIFQVLTLQTLDLSNNELLQGFLPEFQPNGSLRSLLLTGTKFSGALPDSIGNLKMLSRIDLSSCHFSGSIPNSMGNLTQLIYLNMSLNSFTGRIPSFNMANLPSTLTILDLHSNHLQGQLPTLLPSATYLDLSRNNFSSVIPAGIGSSLTFAYFLSLSNNKLSGSIPVSICNSTYLQFLDLSGNLLSGTIPQCFYEMSETLVVLNVRTNILSGDISDSFPVNCGLHTLNLNGNQLGGAVPKSLENCKNLQVLDMGNNQLKDALPCYLKNISSLRVLILRSNKFYGSIDCGGPNTSWPMLQIVDLASNNFTGQLPRGSLSAWKAMMDDVQYLQIPILQFAHIYYQHMITVTIQGFDIKPVFPTIDISNNNLDGPIPEEIGELKSLVDLNLSHNALTGHIPPFLGNLTQLESLELSSNKLTGEIPVQLTGITFLQVLNLSFNQLVGPIPPGMQFNTFSNDSYIHNKELCGFPLTKICALGPRSPPLTFQETQSNSGEIHLNFLSAELGFIFGFVIVIWPLMFWKRWSRWYFTHVDDILIRIFPQLNLGIKYRQRRARIYQGRRH